MQMWFWLFRVPLHFNSNLVVLIPKIPGADLASQLRPIALANFVFKIINRILTERPGPIASRIVFPHQHDFFMVIPFPMLLFLPLNARIF